MSRVVVKLEMQSNRATVRASEVNFEWLPSGPGLFESYGDTTPLLWNDVSDRLRKGPTMTGEISRIVLTFAKRMVGRRSENKRTMKASSLVVGRRIENTHHHQVRAFCWNGAFGQHYASIARFDLDSVVGDA